MKLNEIFNPDYYDYIQDQRERKKFDPDEDIANDSKTSMGDFIVTKYEIGKISYGQAVEELRSATKGMEYEFWMMELNSAQIMKDHDEHDIVPRVVGTS